MRMEKILTADPENIGQFDGLSFVFHDEGFQMSMESSGEEIPEG